MYIKDEPNWLSINQSNLKIEIENKTVLFKALLIWQNVNFCYDLRLKRMNLMTLNQNLIVHGYAFKFDSQKQKICTKIKILSQDVDKINFNFTQNVIGSTQNSNKINKSDILKQNRVQI